MALNDNNVNVLVGAEAWAAGSSGDITLNAELAAKLDLVLCDLSWQWLGLNDNQMQLLAPSEIAQILTDIYIKVCQNPLVDIIAHPFSYGRQAPKVIGPEVFSLDCLNSLAAAMKETNTYFEVMSNIWWWFPQRNPREFTGSYLKMLEILVANDVEFTVGSDSHDVAGVGNVSLSLKLLRQAGAKDSQIVNPSVFWKSKE